MSLIHDDSRFAAEVRGMVLRCRIQIVRTSTSDVVLVTQSCTDNDGPSVVNVAEEFGEILGAVVLGGRPGMSPFVAHFAGGVESMPACGAWPDRGDLFTGVSFDANGEAQFEGIAPDVEAALRAHANPGRGEVERPSPREAPMRALRAVPSGMMPKPHNLFRADCMTVAQCTPHSGPSSCCSYHSVDWNRASRAAIEAVRASLRPDLERDTMEALLGRAWRRVLEVDLNELDRLAAVSLLGDRIVVDGDLENYTNGQHRSTAMKDQGVSEVLVESSLWPGSDPPDWTICALV